MNNWKKKGESVKKTLTRNQHHDSQTKKTYPISFRYVFFFFAFERYQLVDLSTTGSEI